MEYTAFATIFYNGDVVATRGYLARRCTHVHEGGFSRNWAIPGVNLRDAMSLWASIQRAINCPEDSHYFFVVQGPGIWTLRPLQTEDDVAVFTSQARRDRVINQIFVTPPDYFIEDLPEWGPSESVDSSHSDIFRF